MSENWTKALKAIFYNKNDDNINKNNEFIQYWPFTNNICIHKAYTISVCLKRPVNIF